MDNGTPTEPTGGPDTSKGQDVDERHVNQPVDQPPLAQPPEESPPEQPPPEPPAP